MAKSYTLPELSNKSEFDLSSETEDALIRISQVHTGVKRHAEVSRNSVYLTSDHKCFRSQALTSQ